jgi:transposase
VFSLLPRATGRVESGTVGSSPEALAQWTAGLRKRFPEGLIGISVEGHRGGLISYLLRVDFVVVFPINPHASADYRDSFRPSGAKDDSADALMLLDYMVRHPEKLRPLRPDSEEVRLLAAFCEDRRQAVEQRKALSNQLTDCLKAYYPQALKMVDELHSELACAFLSRWPEPKMLKKVGKQSFRKFFYAHNCRSEALLKKRLELIGHLVVLTADRAVIVPNRMKMQRLVHMIRDLNRSIAEYDREIDRLYRQMPDHDIFSSFPGAGDALGPRLLTAFGSDRSRFARPEEIQQLSAVAPVTEQSGNSKWVRRRWQFNSFLHQTFFEYARASLRSSLWAQAYVEAKQAKGTGFNTAIRALAFKWQRIMFACWQNHEPYDETRYLRALSRKGAPIATNDLISEVLSNAAKA